MYRRHLLATALVPAALALTRCANQTIQTVSAQVLADAQGLQNVSQSIISALQTYDPSAITADMKAKIDASEAALMDALKSLSTSTPAATGTPALQKVEAALVDVFQAIAVALPAAAAAFPAIAPFVPMYDAAAALLPGIIAYVNSLVAQFNAKPTAGIVHVPAAMREHLDPSAARARLGIPTV